MIRSAGIIIVRKEKSKWKYLLLRACKYWDFPKGKSEGGEDLLETALRETEEESGITDCDFQWGKIYIETEPYGKKNKISRYYIASTEQEEVVFGFNEKLGKPEHDEYRWVGYGELKKLACPRIKKVAKWARKNMEKVK